MEKKRDKNKKRSQEIEEIEQNTGCCFGK